MKWTVLSDNRSCNAQLETEHGLSILLETGKHRILLDTGASDVFIRNAKLIGIDLSTVDYVFIFDEDKRSGFIYFVAQELEKPLSELRYKEKELEFFQYVKSEYDNWIHEFLQADNKVKHNGSLRPLYDISKPIIVAPDAYELRNRNQQRTATLEINDWEEIMNKTYAFFDKVFEHVTTTI